jgi:hypothetical protein
MVTRINLGHDRAEAILKLHVMQVEAVAARGSFVAADQVLRLSEGSTIGPTAQAGLK